MANVKCVLLDIEGTICPISFVKDTLFPYALNALPNILATKWDSEEFKPYREAFPKSVQTSPEAFSEHVKDLTKRDVKVAYLKNLQGYLWETGYKTGAYATPLFEDVAPQLKRWKDDGVVLAIYSSGSVFAQKLLFGHVASGRQSATRKRKRNDLVDSEATDGAEEPATKTTIVADPSAAPKAISAPIEHDESNSSANAENRSNEPEQSVTASEDFQYLIADWFDTTNAGLKQESQSYTKIARALEIDAAGILFLSDNVKEVDAAIAAGMGSIVVDRPGNAPLTDADKDRLQVVTSLEEVSVVRSGNSEAKDPPVSKDVGRRRSQRLKASQS